MEIADLDKNTEARFLEHVFRDPLDYYFFILDWKFNREDSKFLLALEGGAIRGMMLVYKDHIAQFRGSREATEMLFQHLDLRKADIIVPMGLEDVLAKRYRPIGQHELVLMHLDKGKERILKTHKPVRPSVEDAGEISELMRTTYPDFWGEETAEKIRGSLQQNFWLAIKDDDKVVSVGNTFFADFGSNIGVVTTHEGYRNRGYATSIVSSLVSEIFRRHNKALIHVFSDNNPAARTYQKVGFRPYNSYVLVKAERI